MIAKNLVTISLMIFIIVIIGALGAGVFIAPKAGTQVGNQQISATTPGTKTVTGKPTVVSTTPKNATNNQVVIRNRDDEDDNEDDDNGGTTNPPIVTSPTPPVVTGTGTGTTGSGTTTTTTISAAQVAVHNSSSNCWVIVGTGVYNVTSYIPIHPGGPGQIIPYCGKDATVAFDTKGGRGSHSQNAQNLLSNYYVGNFK